MKKVFWLLISLFVVQMASAQTITQRGAAYRYNGKHQRTPLGNVTINYDANKRTTLSNESSGEFTLTLEKRKMGDRIGLVTVKKRDMMVFNQHAVDEWSVRKEPLRLILCDADEFERQKENLIAIGKREAKKRYDRQRADLEQQLAESKIKQQEYEAKLDKAYEELERARKHMDEYADLFARIDESEVDTLAQQAIELFNRGEVEQAIQKFEEGRFMEKVRQDNRVIEQARQMKSTAERVEEETLDRLESHINSVKAQVEAYKMRNEWEKAGQLLKELADEMKTLDNIFDYAYFSHKQNNYQDAETYYKRALAILEEKDSKESDGYYYQLATLKNNLAIIYSDTQRFVESETMYKEALEICRRLAASNPSAYEPNVAKTLNNLAILYKNTQRFSESEAMNKEALEIRRRLAASNPSAYEPDVAETLNNLAALYSDTQRFSESETMYKEALKIFRNFAVPNPSAYEPYLATTLNNLANLYYKTQRFSEAEAMYKEALQIRRHIAESSPFAYEPDVGQTLNNLANLYYKTQRFSEAESMYKEALEIHRHLAASNPSAYEPDVAQILYNLAGLYSDTQRFSESETMYKEVLEIYRCLAASSPSAYEPDVAMTLNNLALLYYKTQRFCEAETLYKESLEIKRRLAASNPSAYEPAVAMTLNNLALLYYKTQRFSEAESMYKEALEIRKRLAASNPSVYEPEVAQTQYNIGLLKFRQEQYAEAIPPFEEALEIYRRISKVNPAQQQGYEGSLYWLSILYSNQKKYDAAYRINQEWLPLMKKRYEANPDDWRKEYAGTLGSQAFCAIFMKHYTEAEQLAVEGLSVDSTKHFIYANLAGSLLFQGKYNEAEKIYRQYKDELKDGFLDNFKQFAEAGVIPKQYEADVEKIKRMLSE